MKKAASHEFFEEEKPSTQLAVVIPLHPEKKPPKQRKPKEIVVKPSVQTTTAPPVFTAPVFKPKKHFLL
jgi:hypothetical protein